MATQSMKWVVSIFPKDQNQPIAEWSLSPSWILWIEERLNLQLDELIYLPHTLTPEEAAILQETLPYPFDLARYEYVLDGEQIEEEFWAHQVVAVCL